MNLRHAFAVPALVATLLGTGTLAFAQSTEPYPMPSAPAADSSANGMQTPHHHRRNKMMAALRSLDLSDSQRSQIKDAMASYRSSKASGTPMTRDQLRGKIEDTLTPDQRTQFESKMARHARSNGNDAPAPSGTTQP